MRTVLNFARVLTVVFGGLLLGTWAQASFVVSFTDGGVGDGTLRGDVGGASLVFDPVTGAWTVTWTSTDAQPFNGDFVLNLNLGSPGPALSGSFSHTFHDVIATTTLSYSGVSVLLTNWTSGDVVVTSGTGFLSGLVTLPGGQPRDFLESRGVIREFQDIPEPSSLAIWLCVCGSGLIVGNRRRNR